MTMILESKINQKNVYEIVTTKIMSFDLENTILTSYRIVAIPNKVMSCPSVHITFGIIYAALIY